MIQISRKQGELPTGVHLNILLVNAQEEEGLAQPWLSISTCCKIKQIMTMKAVLNYKFMCRLSSPIQDALYCTHV